MMRNPPQIWNGNLAVKSGSEQSPGNALTGEVAASTDVAGQMTNRD